MAGNLDINYLRELHKKKKGSFNKLYFSNTNQVFKGDEKGRLIEVTSSYNVQEEIEVIQNELQVKTLDKNKKFTYDTDGNLIGKIIYKDALLTEKQYEVEYVYSGSDLIKINVTRSSDGFFFSKDFSYDTDSNLESILIT